MGSKKTAPGLMWLIIVILAVPLGIYLIRNNQTPKVQAAAASFNVGVNVTGITHYGGYDANHNDLLLQYAPAAHATYDLQELYRLGVKVIRVWVADKYITDTEAANRLDAFLTKAAQYNISVIATLINFYRDPAFSPRGVAYNRRDGDYYLLDRDFFITSGTNSFRNIYKPFVATVVNKNKNHSNIYAWEIGNELKYGDDGNQDNQTTFINFMNEMAGYIKSLENPANPVPVSTGMMNAAHMGMSASGLYDQLSNNFDIISVHTYDSDHAGAADAAWAQANTKKLVVGEIGYGSNSNQPGCRTTYDRTTELRNELNYWKNQGAAVVLQWGFVAKTITGDNGNGDKCSGMDVKWHSNDYDSLASVFQSFNPTPSPSPSPSPSRSPSPTPSSSPSTCQVQWTTYPTNPSPNTDVTVYWRGVTTNWMNTRFYFDDSQPNYTLKLSGTQDGYNCTLANACWEATVNSGAYGSSHTLKFAINNGAEICNPTKSFTTTIPQPITQCRTQIPNPRVKDGLITTPILYNNFSNTTGACVVGNPASFVPYKIPDYADLKTIYYTQSKATKTVETGNILLNPDNNRLYNYTNATGVSADSIAYGNKIAVIFVEKDLTINRNITGTGGLVIVVGGDIKIATAVIQIDAVLIAGGKIYTAGGAAGCGSSSPVSAINKLVINGSLISLDSNKTIEFCRTLGAGNNTTPAELINNQPKYLVILRNLYSDTLQKWSEIP